MNRSTLLLSSAMYLVILVALAIAAEPTTRPGASTQPGPDPVAIAREIDSIIYSDLAKDQMLAKLKPYVALMDADFQLEHSKFGGTELQSHAPFAAAHGRKCPFDSLHKL